MASGLGSGVGNPCRLRQPFETQVAQDEDARRDLVSRNAVLEDNIKTLRKAQVASEDSVAKAAHEYATLEAERDALLREQGQLQGELRNTSDALANKSADMAAAVAQRSGACVNCAFTNTTVSTHTHTNTHLCRLRW